MILLDGLILGRVAVSVAVSSLIMWTGVADYGTASVRVDAPVAACAALQLLPY
jgi:hypothetical protein